jgi:hypothetical protein
MPATLGELDLKLRALDTTAQAYAGEVQQAVGEVLGALKHLHVWWGEICDEALAGRAAEAHSKREHVLRVFEGWRDLLAEARDRVKHAGAAVRRDLPEAAQLEGEIAALEKILKKITTRWQSAEDLEHIAVERSAPSVEKLRAIRRKYGFPHAWYDEDSKPF